MLGERRPSWIPSPDDAMARLAGRLPAVLAAVGVIHSYRTLTTGQAAELAGGLPAGAKSLFWRSMMGAGLVDVGFPVAVSGKQAVRPDAAPFMAIRLPSRSDAEPILERLGATPAELVALSPPRRAKDWRPLLRGQRQYDRHNLLAADLALHARTAGWLTAGEAWGRFDLMCADPLMGEGGPDLELFGEHETVCVELTASTNQMLAQKFARWDRVLAHPGCETMHVVWVTAGRDSNSDSVLMPALEQLAADRPRMHVAPYTQWRAHMSAMDGWAPQAGDPAPFESDWMHADMGRVAAMVGLPGGEKWRIPARLDPPLLF